MSVSLSRSEGPNGKIDLEIPVAFQRVYRQYWVPAIEELGIKWFHECSYFGKDKLPEVLHELALIREWTLKNVTGVDQESMLKRIDRLIAEIPPAFDREDTILDIG